VKCFFAHEWIVYELSLLLRSVGHRLRVKTHKVTPPDDNERFDIQIRNKGLCHLTTHRTNGALTQRVSSSSLEILDPFL
jgi:hypothetical protein